LELCGSGGEATAFLLGDGDFGQLESDGAGVTHDAGPNLDQLQLQAGQRPVGHRSWQFDAAQEPGQIVGQRVQL
jgi:hypothetical protein